MLKDGIIEYIHEKESSPKNPGNKSFFIQNGDTSTEIRLACALCYFSRFPKIFEKTSIWCFAVCLWQVPELLKGISKFPKNEIKVCENKEFSHFFIHIPFYICDSPHSTHSIQCQQTQRNHRCFVVAMSSSGPIMTNRPSDSSSTMEEAEFEEMEDIIEDLSDDNAFAHCNEDEEEEQEPKLTEFQMKNYFNSTMGGKDLQVLFAMAIGCNSMDIPGHKDPPFS